MTELFSGIAIGLASPAGLIISTLAMLLLGLLARRAVKAALSGVGEDPETRPAEGLKARSITEAREEEDWRRAA